MALIDKASLLMVPSTYEDGTLYNVLPSGNKAPDETGNHNGYDQTRADFTFSRGSNLAATRVNSDGLIEKGRENLLLQSNNFGTTWANYNSTETSGQEGYDGTNDAWQLNKTGASGLLSQSISTTGVQTLSVYAKAGTLDFIMLRYRTTSTNYHGTYFDLANGSVGTETSQIIDSQIESVGNDWYRCSISFNQSINIVYIYASDVDGGIGNSNTGTVFLQDAQLEKGLIASDVITTGSSTAQAGILEDMPRINYDANGENGALLLEPSRTNSLANSEYLLNYSVFSTSPTRTTNYGISPEGVKNSTRIQLDNGDLFGKSPSLSSNTYTFSLFAKNIEGGGNVIQLRFDIPATKYAEFDLSDGTLVQSTTDDEGIEDYGNGWYRCYITMNSSTISNIVVSRPNASSLDCEVFGLQMEIGSYPSSYVPTYGSAVTRSADVCKDAGNSDVFNDSEGVIFVEMSALADDNENRILSISDGTTSTRALIQYYTSSNTIRGFVQGGGVSATLSYTSSDITDNTKIAFKYKSGDHALWVNGTERNTASTAITLSGLDDFSFDNGAGAASMYANVKQVAVFDEALSDSELATLTTL